MQIGGAVYPKEGYISFAPLVEGSIRGAGKFFDRFHDDEHYKGRGLWVGHIYGLNTDEMMKQLQADIGSPPAYGPLNECATVVRRYLKAGGGDEFASWWSRNNIPPISPDDVEDFARSIVGNTKDKGSSERTIRGAGSW